MRVTTWNVNSIRSRLETALLWLRAAQPDVVLLQETKTLDATFPFEPLEDLGYNIATMEQKTYNGVAILSKLPFDEVRRGLPPLQVADEALYQEARYIEADIQGHTFASVYVPNGRSLSDPMFPRKLGFVECLGAHLHNLRHQGSEFLVGGDYNIALDDADVYDPIAYQNHLLFSLPERAALNTILATGIYDVVGTLDPTPPQHRCFTWWDYRQGSWQNNKGLRIDHFLASPGMMDRVLSAWVDTDPRGTSPASDHAPVLCDLRAVA